MTTPSDVAAWMVKELKQRRFLNQSQAVAEIATEFGSDFVYFNRNHNRAISPEVLAAFRELTGDDVVWERGSRCWRYRQPYDPPGRQAR